MVTELFDSISNQPTVAALPISSAPMTKKILSSSQIKLEPSFSINNTNPPAQPLSPLAVNTSTAQQLSSSIAMDPNGNERQFCVHPSNKSYHLTGVNNQSQPLFNSIQKLPESLSTVKNSTAQACNGFHDRHIFLPQKDSFYSPQSTNDIPKMNELSGIALGNQQSLRGLIDEDKTRVTDVAQVGLDDIQFLTDILQTNTEEQSLKAEPLKSVDSSILLDSMDVPLYADVNQYSSNLNSFEIAYKDEDMNEVDADKNDDQGVIGSSSWDTSSSASSASSIGSHFEFSYSQDFSDMVSSDFGVSDIIDWGSVDMIKI